MPNPSNFREPFRMIFKDPKLNIAEEVLVYDFIHDSADESRALCWSQSGRYWFKPYICELTPKVETRTILNG